MRPKGLRDVIAAKDYPLRQQSARGSVRVRGLRDVMAAEEITGRSVPTTHAQRLAEISWLEHESERLQREASILEASMQRIHNRLAEIAERRKFLLGLVRESLGITGQDGSARSRPSTASTKETEPESGFDTVALEY